MKSVLITLSILSIAIPNHVLAAAPTNEELYQMIVELKREQKILKEKAQQAEIEVEAAKHELAITKKKLEAAQMEKSTITSTRPSSFVKINEHEIGAYADISFMLKRPENDRLTYALISQDDVGVLTSKGIDIEPEFEIGGRLGVGYFFDNGIEAFAQYSHLSTSSSASIQAPGGGLELNPKLVPEDRLDFDQNAVLDSAKASHSFDYGALDLGFAQNVVMGERLKFRLGGGLRLAAIDDELIAFYVSGLESIQAGQYNDFAGIGPRLTLDAIWDIPNSNFGLTGMFGTALLYGRNDIRYKAEDTKAGDNDVVSFDNTEKNMYVVSEAKIGLNYNSIKHNIRYGFDLAYEFEIWNDALSSVAYVENASDQLFVREDTDLILHGISFTGRANW